MPPITETLDVPARLTRRIGGAGQFLVDLFLPLVCVNCEREGSLICAECIASMKPHSRPLCPRCAEPVAKRSSLCGDCVVLPPPLDRLVPMYRYDGAVRTAIHALKYRDIRGLAEPLGELMSQSTFLTSARIDCVAPVPMHAKKLRERGYNQASLLGRRLGLPMIEDALSKVHDTPPQIELGRQERIRSTRGAFEVNCDFSGAHVLLLDDVATTGSTLMNCAAALKRANARRVSALTLAKELLPLDGPNAATEEV